MATSNRKNNLTYDLSTKKFQPEQANESLDLLSHQTWFIDTNGCADTNTDQCTEPLQGTHASTSKLTEETITMSDDQNPLR